MGRRKYNTKYALGISLTCIQDDMHDTHREVSGIIERIMQDTAGTAPPKRVLLDLLEGGHVSAFKLSVEEVRTPTGPVST